MTGYVEVREMMPGELLDALIDARKDVYGLALNLNTIACLAEDAGAPCIEGDQIKLLADVAHMAHMALSQLEPMVAALVNGGEQP